jgi:hypothetical protein
MHGGQELVPTPPSTLPPVQPHYQRPFRYKQVLPPILPTGPAAQFNPIVPDWRQRRNTFVEMQDRQSRRMSGQFHYPTRKSRYTPWEQFKYTFIKDKRPWPPVFE